MERNAESVAQELARVVSQIKDLSNQKLCLEAELADLVGSKEEGSMSGSFGDYRVVTTARLNRSLVKNVGVCDVAKVIGDEAAAKLFKVRHELVVSEYRKLTPQQRYGLAPLITAKPSKLSVKVERITTDE